ncbi:MAG: hypothetical protein A2Y93_03260 [Chloroflexi bacterium RBG_13_68_17]|nr:MAG: hypothetical protein A2Y93_03260 [Chloroflexi bacterium RBG_13_68_17]
METEAGMRIGMMADAYKPHVSGVTHHISLTSQALTAAGQDVRIFTLGQEPDADDEPYVVRSPGVPLADSGFYLGFRYTKAARRLLQSLDIVHVHHPFLSGRLALRYSRPVNLPVVFTNHSRYELMAQAYLPLVPDEVSETLLQTYLPAFCRQVDLIIVPSASVRELLQDLGVEDRIEVIPNGVDLHPYLQAKALPRRELGFAESDVLLTYVGRLGPEKNLTMLLRAFAGVHAAFPETALLLVGDGPERDDLEERTRHAHLEERVRFVGMVDYARLPAYLASCDAFVTASVSEVHPLSVIEALASGLPVVGTRSPGIQDTVEDGQTGYLATNDVAAYTAKLTRLVADPAGRKRMAEQARRAATQYAIERTSGLLLEQYERVVRQGPRQRQSNWRVLWHRLADPSL